MRAHVLGYCDVTFITRHPEHAWVVGAIVWSSYRCSSHWRHAAAVPEAPGMALRG